MATAAQPVADGLTYCKGARKERTAQLESKKKQQSAMAPKRRPTKSTHNEIRDRMNQLEDAMTKDNFVKTRTKAMDKSDPNYGRPQEGTRTAERGKKAQTHVHKEILELCEVIYTNGVEDEEDKTAAMLFGDLFRLYTRISDKVVGILMRAKKYGLVYFEPEILFQGQDDGEPVFLVRPMQEIYKEFNEHKKFIMPTA